ncbi:hypothetical protein PR003_g19011 [Phytophthora rubi]|uniref:Uncharacterized protein n=1 Tax=Phytophthora rubi TaxID=129364 RepID=A0A6A4E191_9STRA|nr:hypothetical protein PR003_g19011 [Phytophthora rubi]
MGQTHSAPPDEAVQFRQMVLAVYRGDVEALRPIFRPELRALQISRATYLDICMQEQTHLETLTDSLEREERLNELQDEKMKFFSAVEQGKLALGDTLLHIAVRLGHAEVLEFMLLTDYQKPLKTATPSTANSTMSSATTGRVGTTSLVAPPALPSNTPNFKGELPRDVAGSNCSLQLLLATVDDIHEVFGSSYRDEPKVHRLVRSLRRLWPLWMFEGQQEAAALVRVLYDVRTSDPAFGGLVRVATAVAERFRVAVSRDGIRVAISLLAEHDGDIHHARQALMKDWTNQRKTQEFAAIFRRWFPLFKLRKDDGEQEARIVFFDAAMMTWLQIAQDLRLFGEQTDGTELPDAAGLKRYDSQVWQRRISPPPASIGDLCSMRRPAGLSLSLSPCEPAQDLVHQRICNSAPSRVISDQDEDWNWGSLEASNESTISLGSCALYATEDDRLVEDDQETEDEDTRDAAREDTVAAIEISVSGQPAERAGDFSDFIDPMSPDSTDSNVLYSDSDEPYEYWTKPWSYSRSPFSNCSSLSYEDSDGDENVAIHRSTSTEISSDETKCLPPLASASSSTPAPKLTRFSDVGPGVMRGLTAMIHGTTSFKGPTSI